MDRFSRFYMRPGTSRFSRDPENGACWQRLSGALVPAVTVAAHAYVLRSECESPIEVMLGAQIRATLDLLGEDRISLTTQYRLGPYRYDFALRAKWLKNPPILIECDGAEFHSTPEQVENDKRKDELAHLGGFKLLRFSGSEINRDAEGCATVVLNELISRLRA